MTLLHIGEANEITRFRYPCVRACLSLALRGNAQIPPPVSTGLPAVAVRTASSGWWPMFTRLNGVADVSVFALVLDLLPFNIVRLTTRTRNVVGRTHATTFFNVVGRTLATKNASHAEFYDCVETGDIVVSRTMARRVFA